MWPIERRLDILFRSPHHLQHTRSSNMKRVLRIPRFRIMNMKGDIPEQFKLHTYRVMGRLQKFMNSDIFLNISNESVNLLNNLLKDPNPDPAKLDDLLKNIIRQYYKDKEETSRELRIQLSDDYDDTIPGDSETQIDTAWKTIRTTTPTPMKKPHYLESPSPDPVRQPEFDIPPTPPGYVPTLDGPSSPPIGSPPSMVEHRYMSDVVNSPPGLSSPPRTIS